MSAIQDPTAADLLAEVEAGSDHMILTDYGHYVSLAWIRDTARKLYERADRFGPDRGGETWPR